MADDELKNRVISTDYQGDYLLSQNLQRLSLQQLSDILSLPRQLPEDQSELVHLPWGGEATRILGGVDSAKMQLLSTTVAALFQQSSHGGVASAPEK